MSWFVSTNEDVGDFRLELRTKGFPQTTLFEEDVPYNTRYKILNPNIPGTRTRGTDDVTICLLAKSSSGRIRRWRQNQCQGVGAGALGSATSVRPGQTMMATLLCMIGSYLLA